MLRSIALATTVSLLSAVVSTTAHAGENTQESDAAAPQTPPGAVMATPPTSRPGLGPQPVGRELWVGAAAGAGLALGGGAIAFLSFQDDDGRSQGENAAGGALVGLVAYPLGAALGVAVVGTRGDVYGSLKGTIKGAYLGSVFGLGLGAFLGKTLADTDGAVAGAMLGYLAGAPLGATLAWNDTLKDHANYHEPGTGLVNISGKRARVSVPLVSVTSDPLRPQGTVTSIRLMDGRF